jgi:hypothetical protein
MILQGPNRKNDIIFFTSTDRKRTGAPGGQNCWRLRLELDAQDREKKKEGRESPGEMLTALEMENNARIGEASGG